MRGEWLTTADFNHDSDAPGKLSLSVEDKAVAEVKKRLSAKKAVDKHLIITKDCEAEATAILDHHKPGSRTLVVVNTVSRAVSTYRRLKKLLGPKNDKPDLVLLHSRFRAGDRKKALARLLSRPGDNGLIAVATQVVEAGVDVSATTLFTDLASWPSLVQRFGRCNRGGEIKGAKIFVMVPEGMWRLIELEGQAGLSVSEGKELEALRRVVGRSAAPYTLEDLVSAAWKLKDLSDASPASLPTVEGGLKGVHILRRSDIIDLFDNTPDLSGADIDISRFIREDDERHLQVFWRDVEDDPPADEPAPSREELCPAPIGDIDLKKRAAWRWDHLERRWARPASLYPGIVLMLRIRDGGYSEELGWTGDKKDIPEVVRESDAPAESNDDDPMTASGTWQDLALHTDLVHRELHLLLSALQLGDASLETTLRTAARWHDAGKAHEVFQKAARGNPPSDIPGIVAKSPLRRLVYERPGFRHELASAIAALLNGQPDIVAYLAAAHHGKVRLSLRSLPHEDQPPEGDRRFARGVWEGDVLAASDLGGGARLPETVVDLSFMELGDGLRGPSWLSRMLALRDDPGIGPFRLAYLEALIRVADWRASRQTEMSHE